MHLSKAIEFYTEQSYKMNLCLDENLHLCDVDRELCESLDKNMKSYTGQLYCGVRDIKHNYYRFLSTSKSKEVATKFALKHANKSDRNLAFMISFYVEDFPSIDTMHHTKHPKEHEVIIKRNTIFKPKTTEIFNYNSFDVINFRGELISGN